MKTKPIPAIVATAALALLTAGCGGTSPSGPGRSPQATGPANSPSAVAYSACMRSHGVPGYPDPASGGVLPKTSAQQLGVSSSQYQAAQRSCQHVLPTTGSFQQEAQQCLQAGDCPPSLVQQMLNADRNFARCMRSHGVPNWPDPTIGPQGGPVFNLVPVGITHTETHSPPIETKLAECQRLDPAPAAMESQ
jgi:hypothetical protein